MKKTLIEQRKRIMEIMGNVNEELLSELNVQYLNTLLDKLSDGGMESLSDYEKEALQKMSTDQDDVQPPEDPNNKRPHSDTKYREGSWGTEDTLRFTALDSETGKPLVDPEDNGKTFGDARLKDSFIQGEAEFLAGFDMPVFIDGDLSQLDMPEEEQRIIMVLPNGEYECVSRTVDEGGTEVNAYILTLKEDDDPEGFDLGEMDDYNINNIGEPPEDLRNYEMGEDFDLGEMENYNINEQKIPIPDPKLASDGRKEAMKNLWKVYYYFDAGPDPAVAEEMNKEGYDLAQMYRERCSKIINMIKELRLMEGGIYVPATYKPEDYLVTNKDEPSASEIDDEP